MVDDYSELWESIDKFNKNQIWSHILDILTPSCVSIFFLNINRTIDFFKFWWLEIIAILIIVIKVIFSFKMYYDFSIIANKTKALGKVLWQYEPQQLTHEDLENYFIEPDNR